MIIGNQEYKDRVTRVLLHAFSRFALKGHAITLTCLYETIVWILYYADWVLMMSRKISKKTKLKLYQTKRSVRLVVHVYVLYTGETGGDIRPSLVGFYIPKILYCTVFRLLTCVCYISSKKERKHQLATLDGFTWLLFQPFREIISSL